MGVREANSRKQLQELPLPQMISILERTLAFSKELTEFPYDLFPNDRRSLGGIVAASNRGELMKSFSETDFRDIRLPSSQRAQR